jgi:hypothetical protein
LRDVLSLHPLSLNLPKALRGRGTAKPLVLTHVAFVLVGAGLRPANKLARLSIVPLWEQAPGP